MSLHLLEKTPVSRVLRLGPKVGFRLRGTLARRKGVNRNLCDAVVWVWVEVSVDLGATYRRRGGVVGPLLPSTGLKTMFVQK